MRAIAYAIISFCVRYIYFYIVVRCIGNICIKDTTIKNTYFLVSNGLLIIAVILMMFGR